MHILLYFTKLNKILHLNKLHILFSALIHVCPKDLGNCAFYLHAAVIDNRQQKTFGGTAEREKNERLVSKEKQTRVKDAVFLECGQKH